MLITFFLVPHDEIFHVSGWLPVEPGVEINFDLDSTPLEIKTVENIPDGWSYVAVVLNGGTSEAIYFDFNSPPQYYLRWCLTANQQFSTPIPAETEKIWRITKLPGPRIVIDCNGETVLDFLFSDETCPYTDWRSTWLSDVRTISFLNTNPEVSEYYRAGETKGRSPILILPLL